MKITINFSYAETTFSLVHFLIYHPHSEKHYHIV